VGTPVEFSSISSTQQLESLELLLTLMALLLLTLVELLFSPRWSCSSPCWRCCSSPWWSCLNSCWFRCSLLRLLLRLLTVPASSLVGTPVEFASLSS